MHVVIVIIRSRSVSISSRLRCPNWYWPEQEAWNCSRLL